MSYYKKYLSSSFGVSGYKIHKRRSKKKNPDLSRSKKFASALVKNATAEELVLRDELTLKRIKFDFQRDFRGRDKFYIVDFYLPRANKCGLIVEVDGGYHKNQKNKDDARTSWLNLNTGAEVIRFTNEQIIADVRGVVDTICKHGVQFS